jgi:hypothetical protein
MGGEKGILSTAGKMLSSGQRGAALGTLVGGAIGAGARGIAKRLKEEGIQTAHIKMKKMSVSPLRGVRKTPESNTMIREKFENNLNENRQQIDEVVPLVAAGLAAAGRVALPAAARLAGRYLPKLMKGKKPPSSVTRAGRITDPARIEKRKKALEKLTARRAAKRAEKASKISSAAASFGDSGNAAAASVAPTTQHSTSRREVGRIEKSQDSSVANKLPGDFPTRATQDSQRLRSVYESNIKVLKTIQEGTEKTLSFNDGNQIPVNHLLATKIINIYESINKNNKELMVKMLDESLDSFKKVSNFVVSNRK